MTVNEYTVRDFATKEQVTVLTVRRWIHKGAVETRRTPGGGIRIVERREREGSRAVIFDTSDIKHAQPVR